MTSYKQALVLRNDLDMSVGKLVAQACHASLKAYKGSSEEDAREWEKGGSKKVVLETDESGIKERHSMAREQGLGAYLVKDAGLTEVEPGTVTALGIGPAEESKIDKITGDLKLLK